MIENYTDSFLGSRIRPRTTQYSFKFGGLGTFEQLIQGHKIEKLHVMAGLKLFKKYFLIYFDSLFLILVGCSLRSIVGSAFQILGKRFK